MRTWRVGTISMGLSLLLLGIILLISQWKGLDLTKVLVAWWPVILIVLGLEILVSLFLIGKEKPFLKYDVLSIFLVGLLGTVGIGFAILSSTGFLGKAAEYFDRKEQTFDLPAFVQGLQASVKRVVIEADHSPLTIEGTVGNEVAIFGTYRTVLAGEEPLLKDSNDYLSVQEKGDTLYIRIKKLPEELGPFYADGEISATIVVPNNLQLEVLGDDNSLTLKPRMLLGNWTVEDAYDVSLYVQDNSDLAVTAIGVEEFVGRDDLWKTETIKNEADNSQTEGTITTDQSRRTFQVGKGTHHLYVLNANTVSLNQIR